jgi:hypothetical protein
VYREAVAANPKLISDLNEATARRFEPIEVDFEFEKRS